MNRITKCLAWLCIITCCLSCVGCEKKAEPQPILKVITSSQIGVTIFSYKRYYAIYDNGKKKKIPEFSPSEVIGYAFNPDAEEKDVPYLHLVDIDAEEGAELNNIAKNIVNLTTKNEDNNVFSPGKLRIINNHYYFTALLEKDRDSIINGLFEYYLSDNSFIKIATFSSSITHVEAYQ